MSVEDHLQSGEQVIYQAQVSRVSLAPWLVLAVVLGVGGLVTWHQTADATVGGLALLPFLAAALYLLVRYLVLRSHEYVLTDRRVIRQTGILSKQSVDSRLDKVNNVEHRQTVWGRLLGYGDVWVDTASETGITMFQQISEPVEFKRAIIEAAEAYRTWGRGPAAAPSVPAQPSGAERLRQLKALFDDGLISREEFEAKRAQLLAEL
jgi:membrane protein YdbS with pleckstrin-like domain